MKWMILFSPARPVLFLFFLHFLSLDSKYFPFLGKNVTKDDWNKIKSKIECYSKSGTWKKKKLMKYDSILNGTEYFQKYAPCRAPYNTDHYCSQLDSSSSSVNYFWDTQKACGKRLETFSSSRFCEVMFEKGNILIVGDSISHEFYISLANHFMMDEKRDWTICPMVFDVPCYFGKKSWTLKIYQQRNDRLSLVNEAIELNLAETRFQELPWAHLINERNIGLLVLNRGAHYENDTKLMDDLKATFSHLHSFHSNVSIIWRNTPHGHMDHTTSLRHAPLLKPPPSKSLKEFHYSYFKHQNELLKAYLKKHHPHVIYMDVFQMTVLRADSHRDQLHYCIPGPIDEWVILFYNILLTVYYTW